MNTQLPILESRNAGAHSGAAGKVAPDLTLDPRTYGRALSCVHCGLCLPACPTYTETGHEGDSPRGRIQLMRGLADGAISLTPTVQEHLDLCLDCRACETACPSGVVYHELIEETRMRFAHTQRAGMQSRLMRALFFQLLTRPFRLKLALLPARLLQKLGIYALLRRSGVFGILPAGLAKMEQMLPGNGQLWPRALPEITPPPNRARPSMTIGFLPGCVGGVMFSEVNRKAVELLAAGGAEVVVPARQTCCGAIHHHNGDHDSAMSRARRNIDAFIPVGGKQCDLIVTAIAGCGAMLREYDVLLRDDAEYAARAKVFASRVRDVSEALIQLPLPEPRFSVNATATYHDACHLAHAQKVTAAPRKLLARVPGLKLVALPESDMCCGAAGTYNLTQPEMATKLADRKLRHIASTRAAMCITGNVGCAMHIQSRAHAAGQTLRVMHPVEILHRGIFGGDAAESD